MFEQETKYITDHILSKLKNIGEGVTVDRLFPLGVHPAVLRYITSELDYLIFVERKRILNNSAFDYSGPEIEKYYLLIAEEIKKTKLIGFEDIRKLIVQAVSFNLNYLCRPKWALTKLIFDGKSSVTVDEIKMLLNHLYYYDYLRNIISSYIRKREIKTLTSVEFELILNRIDKELYASESKKLVENALWSLAEFINIGSNVTARIPAQPVEVFLKEKNLIEMLFRLRRVLPIEARQRYEVKDIKEIIFSDSPIDLEKLKEYDASVQEKQNQSSAENKTEDEDEITPDDSVTEDDQFTDEEPEFSELEQKFIAETQKEYEFTADVQQANIEIKPEAEPEQDNSDSPPEYVGNKVESTIPVYGEEDLDISPKQELNEEEQFKNEEVIETLPEEIKNSEFELADEDDIYRLYSEELKSLEELEKELDITASALKENELIFEEEIKPDTNSEEIEKELLNSEEFSVTGEAADIPSDSNERLDHLAEPENEDADKSDEIKKSKLNFNFFRKKEQPLKQEPLPRDIISYFTEKEIKKIISSVFNDDKDDFTVTLEKIAECGSYEEATEIIKSVFLTYRINPYTREAVTLTNAVADYFDQR